MNATCSMNPNLTLQHQVGSMEGSGEPAALPLLRIALGAGKGIPGGQCSFWAGASVAAATHLCRAPLVSRDTLGL